MVLCCTKIDPGQPARMRCSAAAPSGSTQSLARSRTCYPTPARPPIAACPEPAADCQGVQSPRSVQPGARARRLRPPAANRPASPPNSAARVWPGLGRRGAPCCNRAAALAGSPPALQGRALEAAAAAASVAPAPAAGTTWATPRQGAIGRPPASPPAPGPPRCCRSRVSGRGGSPARAPRAGAEGVCGWLGRHGAVGRCRD